MLLFKQAMGKEKGKCCAEWKEKRQSVVSLLVRFLVFCFAVILILVRSKVPNGTFEVYTKNPNHL